LVAGSRWVPDTKTDWPTDYRSYINFNFNFVFSSERAPYMKKQELVRLKKI
jgi:hypothetical protein